VEAGAVGGEVGLVVAGTRALVGGLHVVGRGLDVVGAVGVGAVVAGADVDDGPEPPRGMVTGSATGVASPPRIGATAVVRIGGAGSEPAEDGPASPAERQATATAKASTTNGARARWTARTARAARAARAGSIDPGDQIRYERRP
jgi:hypothetical protein